MTPRDRAIAGLFRALDKPFDAEYAEEIADATAWFPEAVVLAGCRTLGRRATRMKLSDILDACRAEQRRMSLTSTQPKRALPDPLTPDQAAFWLRKLREACAPRHCPVKRESTGDWHRAAVKPRRRAED